MANILCIHLFFFALIVLLSPQTLVEAQNGGFSVRLIHRNSPDSPLYNPDELNTHRFHSYYRVPKKSFPPNNPFTRVTSNNGDYIMKLSFGTPQVDIYGLADTGSDLVWAQCEPCYGCYNQKNPKFDPKKSTTLNAIPCDSDQCNLLQSASCSSENLCEYSYAYADSSVTNGLLSKDKVTLSSSTGEDVVVGDIVFGCGHNNSGNFNENDMGLFGLGGGPLSFVSQLGSIYGIKRFSQCLVPFHTDPDTPGTMRFGEGSKVLGDGVVTTPLVSEEGQTLYMVTLQGISVGDNFVPFNSSEVLSKGNIIIDSGTPTTYIPQDFYDNLVKELMEEIELVPIQDDPDLGSQLCYRSDAEFEAPILTAHFEGADVQLMSVNTFIPPKDGVFCFAVAGSSDGLHIFGNFAQSNYLIGFDLDQRTISFKLTDCTNQ